MKELISLVNKLRGLDRKNLIFLMITPLSEYAIQRFFQTISRFLKDLNIDNNEITFILIMYVHLFSI